MKLLRCSQKPESVSGSASPLPFELNVALRKAAHTAANHSISQLDTVFNKAVLDELASSNAELKHS
jgi:hypothetical protein